RRRRHMNRIDAVHPATPRRDLPPFRPGDTVRVHVSITEGDKQRIQVFEGVVIRRRGRRASATFTVRKISYGVGVERIFLTEAPSVTRVEIKSRGHVRRARLYYLRDLRGKRARARPPRRTPPRRCPRRPRVMKSRPANRPRTRPERKGISAPRKSSGSPASGFSSKSCPTSEIPRARVAAPHRSLVAQIERRLPVRHAEV